MSQSEPGTAETLMQMLEGAQTAVAAITGIKAQFIAAGWTGPGAEQATVELMRSATANRGKAAE